MKKPAIALLFLAFLLALLIPAHAEDDSKYIPPGMEILKVGDANILVPKGTRMRKKGDLNVVEDTSEYMSRKFLETEKRFDRLELDQIILKNRVNDFLTEMTARNELLEEEIKYLRETIQRLERDRPGLGEASLEEGVRINVELEKQQKE
ncbi:MAG: hypothetical protein V3S04_04590 [Candidatus Omnitrophota bacterium]